MSNLEQNIEEQLAKNGFYVSTTVGYSMRPMLRNRRDRVVLVPVGDKILQKYDLPLYHRPDGKYILHRIIDVKDGYYLIRGDNTYTVEKVPFSWVIAYTSEFYRGKKHVDANDPSYRRYAAFWNRIYPLRAFLQRCRSVASKIKHRIFK